MIVLALGVSLWAAIHFFPSVTPALRERLIDGVGHGPYRGLFSVDILISLALIIWGYRTADWIYVYDPPAWGVHANNTLMLLAIYLFGAGGARGWLATKLRHPMLTGAVVWGVAHLLANGDQASIVLFGGMALWALGMIWIVNRRTGAWAPPKHCGLAGELKLIAITLVIFAVITFAHGWLLGVNPFPG
jgi:uncharacterized membrane protein